MKMNRRKFLQGLMASTAVAAVVPVVAISLKTGLRPAIYDHWNLKTISIVSGSTVSLDTLRVAQQYSIVDGSLEEAMAVWDAQGSWD